MAGLTKRRNMALPTAPMLFCGKRWLTTCGRRDGGRGTRGGGEAEWMEGEREGVLSRGREDVGTGYYRAKEGLVRSKQT